MNSNDKQKPLALATGEENRRVTRLVLECLNAYPQLPVKQVNYGMLQADKPGIALAADQGAVIVKRYITGGHKAEYNFALVYRIKAGNNNDKRLKADEALDSLGDWACAQRPPMEGARAIGFAVAQRAALDAAYPNGDEDHQIILKFTYEVNE